MVRVAFKKKKNVNVRDQVTNGVAAFNRSVQKDALVITSPNMPIFFFIT